MALESDRAKGIYNIGSGNATSLNSVIKIMEEVTGKKPAVMSVMERPSDAVKAIALDASKARKEFGWRPTVDLREGIKKTWRWVQAGEPFQLG